MTAGWRARRRKASRANRSGAFRRVKMWCGFQPIRSRVPKHRSLATGEYLALGATMGLRPYVSAAPLVEQLHGTARLSRSAKGAERSELVLDNLVRVRSTMGDRLVGIGDRRRSEYAIGEPRNLQCGALHALPYPQA